jgi:hypothetical protein
VGYIKLCLHRCVAAGGVVLTMVTVFLLGVLATNAEPALCVLGVTVESLSGGRFTKRLLVWAVSIGVAVGMDIGRCAGRQERQLALQCRQHYSLRVEGTCIGGEVRGR